MCEGENGYGRFGQLGGVALGHSCNSMLELNDKYDCGERGVCERGNQALWGVILVEMKGEPSNRYGQSPSE